VGGGWRIKRGLVLVSEDVFADFDLGGAEIDEHAVLQARGAEVAENLGGVVVVQGAHGFKFDDGFAVYEEVGEEFAQQTAILVEDIDRVLLVDFRPSLRRRLRREFS